MQHSGTAPARLEQAETGARTDSDAPTVFVLHPLTLLRHGIVRLLREHGLDVVADAGTLDEALVALDTLEPSVVVIDGDIPEAGAPDVVRAIRARTSTSRLLVVAERIEPDGVGRALAEGADGYTLKDVSLPEFIRTIRRVALGEVGLHPAAASALVRGIGAHGLRGRSPAIERLTPRQQQILDLLVEGLQNKQIARRLDIGTHTVKTHISRILEKLGAASRTEAAVIAARRGLAATK